MTITLRLPPETVERIEDEAAQRGQSVDDFMQTVVEQGLAALTSPPSTGKAVNLMEGIRRRSAEELIAQAREQGVKPVERFEDLLGDFWPEDESVDEFLAGRRQWQREGAQGFPYDEADPPIEGGDPG